MSQITSRNWKDLNEYKASLTLTQEQREILAGGLLGDLSLRKIGKFSRLVVEQKNKDYLFHLYDVFKVYVRTPPQERLQKRLQTSEVKSTWYFSTISHSNFEDFYTYFYPCGKKRLPDSLQPLLTPRSLAYWYMDDGCLKNPTFALSTANFSLEEHQLLQSIFYNNWGIKTSIQGLGSKSGYLSLYIPVSSSQKFLELIKPFIVPSMRYKLPSCPATPRPVSPVAPSRRQA